MSTSARFFLACLLAATLPIVACMQAGLGGVEEWWAGHGPVVPHETFPGDCSLCHTTSSWTELKTDLEFDHAAETGFALNGAHSAAQCLRCHNDRGPVAVFASRGCAGCHGDVHEGRLGKDCAQCHDEDNWQVEGQVAEHARTRFPLYGTHATVSCDRCHTGIASGVIDPLPLDCASCHQADLASALEPNHFEQGWVGDCQECHVPTTWSEDGFRHDGFPLTGAHGRATCEACHGGGVFGVVPGECIDCHLTDYQTVRDPDHVAFGYPQQCDQCHGVNTFAGARFDHSWITQSCVDCHLQDYLETDDPDHQLEGYPQSCEDCHSTEDWRAGRFDHAGVVDDCVQCHLQNYLATSDPNHQQEGYPPTCELCHTSTTQWRGANFDHAGVTQGCVDCHFQDYLGTNDPPHAALAFPTQCEACHDTVDWGNGDFDHDFPIDSGKHRGLACNECHQSAPNYTVFTCTDCHAHRFNDMAQVHQGIPGWSYDTLACYSCHPDGRKP